MARRKQKNTAAQAKAAKARKAKEVLDLTCEKATLRYIRTAVKKENTLPETVILDILVAWPDLFREIPQTWLTPSVAEWIVRKDPTSFQFCGPIRANISVVLAAAFARPRNWEYAGPSIFGNKEFVWWAIDMGFITPYSPEQDWTKDQLACMLPLLKSEEGAMCLLAKYGQWMGFSADLEGKYECPRFNSAMEKVVQCKQPFDVMRDILRKRLLLARLFEGPWYEQEIELARIISGYLTVPLVFYSILEGGDRRYRKLCKKR